MPALDVLFKEFHLIPDNVPSIQHNPAESVERQQVNLLSDRSER